MIFLKINCPNFSRLVWCRHTKFQIGMAPATPAILLPAPLDLTAKCDVDRRHGRRDVTPPSTPRRALVQVLRDNSHVQR